MDATQASFGGAFDSVTIEDAGAAHPGAGSLSGFFTGNAQRALTGAGMSYGLSDGNVDVAGTAAFGVAPPGP